MYNNHINTWTNVYALKSHFLQMFMTFSHALSLLEFLKNGTETGR